MAEAVLLWGGSVWAVLLRLARCQAVVGTLGWQQLSLVAPEA